MARFLFNRSTYNINNNPKYIKNKIIPINPGITNFLSKQGLAAIKCNKTNNIPGENSIKNEYSFEDSPIGIYDFEKTANIKTDMLNQPKKFNIGIP